ncbi:hypothetical protein RWD45_19540 [Virgibacillus soli]|uniref:Uncharacterized protein n=1 Tax=Paracerasibacillus soli TaxID=480284 RepID=A0ABU5CWT2_9BACI|nr:hypothetical protein [Virgibacillus soli]MDY0410336.1 hypothetical protein [Virgibacillus soli]
MQTYLRAGIVLLSILLVLVACSNTENENRQKKKKEVHITISAAVSLKESLEEIEMIYVKDHQR